MRFYIDTFYPRSIIEKKLWNSKDFTTLLPIKASRNVCAAYFFTNL